MPNQEETPTSGKSVYQSRLRTNNVVDYSYKKRKIRYVNPLAKVVQEKRCKVHQVRTTKNVNHSSNKRKMNYVNPFAVERKKKKVEAYQSRSKNVIGSSNESINRIEESIAIKREEDLAYNFRSRKIVNYSFTKKRAKRSKKEKEDGHPIKLEPDEDDLPIKRWLELKSEPIGDDGQITSEPDEDDLPIKRWLELKSEPIGDDGQITSEPDEDDLPIKRWLELKSEPIGDDGPITSELRTDDLIKSELRLELNIKSENNESSMKSVDSEFDVHPLIKNNEDDSSIPEMVVRAPPPTFEYVCPKDGALQEEIHSNAVNCEMKSPNLIIKTESTENGVRRDLEVSVDQCSTNTHIPISESVEDTSDDLQFIPNPVTLITINDDDDDDNEDCKSKVKLEIHTEETALNSVAIGELKPCEKTETKVNVDELLEGAAASDDSDIKTESGLFKQENESEMDYGDIFEYTIRDGGFNRLTEVSDVTESLESLFRDRNGLEEPNNGVLNAAYLRRYVWELENKYKRFEVYSFDGVADEVGGIEQLTEEQLQHSYYTNYQPEPQLSESQKEEIELEKDRICEEASGFNNHLWRRPLNGGPFAQTDDTPIPRCPEYIHAFTPAGQLVSMKTDADRPPKFRTDYDRRLWDFATIFNFNRYREDIEYGDYLPPTANAELESQVLQLGKEINHVIKSSPEMLPFEKMLMLNELKLHYWDKCVKTCLPHLEKLAECLLDEIIEAPVYLFSYIKHVQIYVAVRKVMLQKRYPGLRSKATLLYEKIKENAILGEETLDDYIFSHSKLLHEYFKNASVYDMMRLNASTARNTIIQQIGIELTEKKEEDDNALDQDAGENNASDDNDSDGSDNDDNDDDDGYSGTYDEVGSSSSFSDVSDSEHGELFFFEDDVFSDEDDVSDYDSSSDSSSSEDEALMDDIIREE
ncbi:uncharacterized protein LOC111049859 [Nilaparvata lugens]|uniref:uncharacterized protein LOC111049859 n=1 Tax=Nilaparvata lugens TaxID=108931 RepID=UPI00193C9C96|nr:uncharacterized protein LOC111049859 [Nilaparvata lugens]